MTITKVILLLAFLAASASSGPLIQNKLAKIDPTSRVDGDYRLPNNTAPISYDIRLIPYMVVDNFTFDGEAKIFLRVLEPTLNITVHSNALTYDESLTTLVSEDGVVQTITSHNFVTAEHFLIIGVQNELPVGNYTLSLTFDGILAADMAGFYRSSYVNAAGDTVWLATTHFEPTSARRAFPCYDEPGLKATFDISIKHEPELHALSNMPIAQKDTDTTDGKVWTVFQTTPIMSSYLVAFVVSDYTAIQNTDGSYGVWSRPNALSESQYTYDIGIIELAELENFTNVTYKLPKIDQISIPDFSAGAMENWGLVTYRESNFHYNESYSTLTTKQSIATVISHEFAHQWFGNLVSPTWWKYLWLNEGFATYFQYLTTDAAEDNWRLMEQFVVKVQQATAFTYDSSAFSHPMNQDVASPAEISSIFDSISYQKAGSVIRMISHFLTEDVFKAGLTKYLNAKAYSGADSDDLFEALQEAATEAYILPSHVYVKDILDTWVEQMGYPVVTLTRNYTTATTEITQERFLLGDADVADDHDYKWWIPINWATQASPNFTSTVAADWIRSQDSSIMISGFAVTGWVIFNKQQTGYYRVNYDDTNWRLIANYLNSDDYKNIHVLNRAALIDDAFNLAKADRLSYTIVLDLILYLQREVDYIAWYPAFTGFSYLQRLLANTEEWETYRTYLAFLLTNVFETVGIEETDSDDHVTRFNRANAINHACNYGLESCRSSAEAKLIAWLDDSTANPLSANLRTNTICAGLRGANATTWNRALDRYLNSESTTERTALLAGLGCSEDEAIINNWLSAIINSETGLSTSVSSSAFIYVYQGSSYNVERAFDFIVDNLDSIIAYFGGNTTVQTFVLGISYRFTTADQLQKLNEFIAAQSTILGTIATSAVSNAESNIAWNTAYGEVINTWTRAWLESFENITTEASTTVQDPQQTTTVVTTTVQDPQQTTTEESTTVQDPQQTTTVVTTTVQDPQQTTTVVTTTEDFETTTVDNSSASTAYLSFFAVILVFVCLVEIN